jgi:hypothetical protein
MPIPRKIVAESVLRYFRSEREIVELFTIMMQNEGLKKGGSILEVRGKEVFIKLLDKFQWIFDRELGIFYQDPFISDSINVLESIQLIDLRNPKGLDKILETIKNNSESFQLKELEWQITLRLYHLDRAIESIVKNILELLLGRLDLEEQSFDIFITIKELATNASKANFKQVFEKYITSQSQINSKDNYIQFLTLFKEEIAENGAANLLQYAQQEDLYFDIKFKSSKNLINLWIQNYIPISTIEKKNLLSKLKINFFGEQAISIDDELAEGAGLGLSMVLMALGKIVPQKGIIETVIKPK